MSEDGLQAVFALRAGAAFHDGTPLDARAVKDNFERQFRPNHPLYSQEPRNTKEQLLTQLVDSIEVRDDLTLAFKLKYPGLHYLSQIEIASPTALAKLGKDFARAPSYTGPSSLSSWDKDRLVLVAYDRYWGGRPKVDRVVFQFIPGGDAVVEAMLKGGVDFSSVLPEPTLFERLREDPRIKLAQVPGLNVFYLGFYTERAPLNNPHLRRAVAHAVNAERAAQALGRGVALPAKGPLSPAMLGYDPSVSQAAYDPRAARELVARSGGRPNLTLRLVHNNTTPFDVDLASSIRVDLRQIGITVQSARQAGIRRDGQGGAGPRGRHVHVQLACPLAPSGAPAPPPLPLQVFRHVQLDAVHQPETGSASGRGADGAGGPAQAKLYSQIQQTIVDDAPMVFLYHSTRMAAYADRVNGSRAEPRRPAARQAGHGGSRAMTPRRHRFEIAANDALGA